MKVRIALFVIVAFCLQVVVTHPDAAASARPSSARLRQDEARRPDRQPGLLPGQSATLMQDGRWLLIGGEKEGIRLATAELWDPRTATTAPLESGLSTARSGHSATILPNGTVLILGGSREGGEVVPTAEIYDPLKLTFTEAGNVGLLARTQHSATLLTDGRVLVAGGILPDGTISDSIEFIESWTMKATAGVESLRAPRFGHSARLLADGNVLLWGGSGVDGAPQSGGEVYESVTGLSRRVDKLPEQGGGEPRVVLSSPEDGESGVRLGATLVVRFSRPVRPQTVGTGTVELKAGENPVRAKVVSAEGGLLLFVTPFKPLARGTEYRCQLDGVADEAMSITPIEIRFTTEGSAIAVGSSDEGPEWTPDSRNLDGDWTSGREASSVEGSAELRAPDGATAVSGQVRSLDGRPLAKVELRLGGLETRTDETGRFLLVGVAAGQQELIIHGQPASTKTETYGMFEVGLFVREGRTNVLPYTIWMPVIDTVASTSIEGASRQAVVAKTPRMPGLEIHIPARTVLRVPPAHDLVHGGDAGHGAHHAHSAKAAGPKGRALESLSVTALPIDRPPFPAPFGMYMMFTFQTHGAQVESLDGASNPGVRIVYPNYPALPTGTRVSLWSHDSSVGWYVYGEGEVSENGEQIIPDPGVGLFRLNCGQAFGPLSGAPGSGPQPIGPKGEDGDPVDLSTGLFVYKKIDVSIPDVIPIVITRTYRQNDAANRTFGKGTSAPYDLFLVADSIDYYSATFVDLVLPDGGRIRFDRTSPIGSTDEFEHIASPSPFYKSTLVGGAPEGGWQIRLKDGTVYYFKTYHYTGTESASPRLESITDRYGNQLRIVREELSPHKITRIVSPNGRWVDFSHDASGSVSSITDNIGRTVTYEYDLQNRLTKVTNQAGGFVEYTYDSAHRMLTSKDPRGIVYLTNEYDTVGRVSRQIQADLSTFEFDYTLDENTQKIIQTDVTNPRGFVHRATFNSVGAMITEIFAVGTAVEQAYTIERNGSNFVLSVTDALGRITAFGYDGLGNRTSVTTLATTAAALTTTVTYESAFNQPLTFTDTLGRTTTVTYDSLGSPSSIAEPGELPVTFEFNAFGLPESATYGTSSAQFEYRAGEQVAVQHSAGPGGRRVVDAAGRTIRVVDALGSVSRREYDATNRMTAVIDNSGNATLFDYDASGNLLNVEDAAGNETTYVVDSMNRVETRTDPSNVSETFDYDENGNLVTHTDRRGIVTTRQYDALDRLTQVAISGGGGTIDYGYDAGNRLTSVIDSVSGTTTFVYDLRNRLLSETTPRGTVSWTYDNGGRRLTMQATGQDVVTYGYNAADRVTSITQGFRSATFEYDAQMRRSALNVSTGVRVEYAWDEASRPVGIAYFEDGAPIGDLTYEFDAASRVVATGGSLARTELPQEIADTGISPGNRLTEVDSQVLTYDAAGNLVGDGTLTYSWNSRNQLATVTGPGVAASFSYDALGRRTAKTVNGVTTEYLHDGGSVIREAVSGGATTNVLLGLGVDETLVRYGSGNDRTTLADSLGSTVATVDDSGANDAEFTYGPFGETTSSGSSDASAPQYTGRENDGTGLYYYRARYYSPSLKRFISEDPIGFAGGSANLYAYVGNSPTNFRDPSGLVAWFALLDSVLDYGFVIYDVYVIATDSEKNFTTNALALTADAAAIAVPFLTGLGLAVRAWRAAKRVDHAVDAGRGGRFVDDFATKSTRNWSATFNSEGEARALARTKLGSSPVEVEPGKWRSADGKWQYRAKPGDVSDGHIHLEELNPQTGEVLQNVHLRWPAGGGR